MRIRNWFGRWRPKKWHGNKGNYPNISSDPTQWTRFCLGNQKGESLWNQRSTELVRFQQTYGHCRVPRPEIYTGPSLPNGFVDDERNEWRNWMLLGFVWVARRARYKLDDCGVEDGKTSDGEENTVENDAYSGGTGKCWYRWLVLVLELENMMCDVKKLVVSIEDNSFFYNWLSIRMYHGLLNTFKIE